MTQIRLNTGVRASSATIRLDPPELGRMRIDVRLVDDALQVRIEASTPQARQMLRARVSELAAALREHHIEVERFEVVGARAAEGAGSDAALGPETEEDRQANSGNTLQDASGGARRENEDAHPEETGGDGLEVEAPKPDAVREPRLDVRI